MKAALIIICGLPGSGKTTLAKELEKEFSALRFCPDERMQQEGISLFSGSDRSKIEKDMWQSAQRQLKNGGVAIIEFGSWGKSERLEMLQRAKELGATVELYIFDPPVNDLRKRLQERGAEGDQELLTNDGNELKKADKAFQRPKPDELRLYDKYHLIGR